MLGNRALGLRVQGCRLRLGLTWADAGQHSAGPGGDLGHQPGAAAKAWLLEQGRCLIAGAARTPLGWPLPHPFLPGLSELFSLPTGGLPRPQPPGRGTHTAGSRCPRLTQNLPPSSGHRMTHISCCYPGLSGLAHEYRPRMGANHAGHIWPSSSVWSPKPGGNGSFS